MTVAVDSLCRTLVIAVWCRTAAVSNCECSGGIRLLWTTHRRQLTVIATSRWLTASTGTCRYLHSLNTNCHPALPAQHYNHWPTWSPPPFIHCSPTLRCDGFHQYNNTGLLAEFHTRNTRNKAFSYHHSRALLTHC